MSARGLEHVVARPRRHCSTPSRTRTPTTSQPATTRPNPYHETRNPSPAVRRRGQLRRPGSGGRQPMTVRRPQPASSASVEGRRPVVATLDTGCGEHPWLDAVVRTDVKLGTDPIGYVDDADRPGEVARPGRAARRRHRRAGRPRHLHRGPDPPGLSGRRHRRLADRRRPTASSSRATWSRRSRTSPRWLAATATASPAATRSTCSASRSATTTRRRRTSSSTRRCTTSCAKLGECGVAVVCSAGNDATARPMFPAAWAPWLDDEGTVHAEPDVVPIVSVGALNPNGTDALFSNAGPWVRAYARGASVMSTIPPPFQGGLQPMARTEAYRRAPRVDRPRRLHAAGSRCGAARRSPRRSSPGSLARRLCDTIDPADDGRAAGRTWRGGPG